MPVIGGDKSCEILNLSIAYKFTYCIFFFTYCIQIYLLHNKNSEYKIFCHLVMYSGALL